MSCRSQATTHATASRLSLSNRCCRLPSSLGPVSLLDDATDSAGQIFLPQRLKCTRCRCLLGGVCLEPANDELTDRLHGELRIQKARDDSAQPNSSSRPAAGELSTLTGRGQRARQCPTG